MYDLMISYARRDLKFVRNLAESLAERGKDVWVDLDGIFVGDEWWERICAAIDDSDNVLFVVTPHAIRSRYCRREVKYASNRHKSILPILYRKVAHQKDIPTLIRKLQWIDFQNTHRICDVTSKVLDFIDENPMWKRYHSQILHRARLWERLGRYSALLAGEDLAEANRWVQDSGKLTKVRPTGLERKFVQASNERAQQVARLQSDLISSQLLRTDDVDPELAVALCLAAIQEFAATKRTLLALATYLWHTKTITIFEGHDREVFDKAIHSVAVSKNERLVASAAGDGAVRLWDFPSGHEVLVYDKHERNTLGEPWAVLALAWSPDGRLIASGGKDGFLRIWDAKTGRDSRVLHGHSHWLNHLAWSPDGRRIATSSRDATLVVWDIESGGRLRRFRFAEFSPIRALAWNSEGNKIACVSDDGFVRILNAVTGGVVARRRLSRDDAIVSIDWHPITDLILTYVNSDEGTGVVHILKSGDLAELSSLRLEREAISCVRWSKSGDFFAVGTNLGRIVVANRGPQPRPRTLHGHRAPVTSIAWLDSDRKLVSGSEDSMVRVWSLDDEHGQKLVGEHAAGVSAVHWRSNARLVSAGFDGKVVIYEGPAHTRRRTIQAYPRNQIRQVALSARCSRILTGADCRIARLWNARTRAKMAEFKGFRDWATAVAWSPRDDLFVVGDRRIRVYRARDFKEVTVLAGHEDALHTVAWSPDGRFLASTGLDMLLIIWDMTRFVPVRKQLVHDDKVFGLDWSPDGRHVVTSSKDRSAKVWPVRDENLISVFVDHTDTVWCARWSPDGKYVATGSADGTFRIWDPFTGQGVLTIPADEGAIYSLDWTGEPHQLVTGSAAGSVRLWNLVLAEEHLVRIAKSRIVRPLTREERLSFGLAEQPIDSIPTQVEDKHSKG